MSQVEFHAAQRELPQGLASAVGVVVALADGWPCKLNSSADCSPRLAPPVPHEKKKKGHRCFLCQFRVCFAFNGQTSTCWQQSTQCGKKGARAKGESATQTRLERVPRDMADF